MDNYQPPQPPPPPPPPTAHPGGNGYQQFNPNYPPQQQYQQPQMAPVISVKEWMLIMFVMIIPLVNIIMMFVWAFSEGNPNRQNYFKASLLWLAIVIGLYILFIVFIVGLFAALDLNSY